MSEAMKRDCRWAVDFLPRLSSPPRMVQPAWARSRMSISLKKVPDPVSVRSTPFHAPGQHENSLRGIKNFLKLRFLPSQASPSGKVRGGGGCFQLSFCVGEQASIAQYEVA